MTSEVTDSNDNGTAGTHSAEDLNVRMQATFVKNMAAFKKYMPEVADKFREYQPKNLQLFCAKSGDANLVDMKQNTPLYNDDPVAQCRGQVDKIINNPQYTKQSFDLRYDGATPFIHSKYLGEMYHGYLDAAKIYEPLTTIPDHLGTMIIFGVGLGYHLPELLKRITIDQLFICEPNIDWLYASMYNCDWDMVLETIDKRDGRIRLQFGITYEQFGNDFINEMKSIGGFNSTRAVLYRHYDEPGLNSVIEHMDKNFHLMRVGWGFFDDGIISIAHDFANAAKKIPVLKIKAELPKQSQATPAFILANGPSLDEDMEIVKQHQGDAVIFSCGSVINTLLKNDIIPDFHLELERTQFTYDYLKELVCNETMKKINFLTINAMHPDCTSLFKWTGIGFKPAESSTVIACDLVDQNQTYAQLRFCNPVMANCGLSFACYMGFKEIYLFGVDCGYFDPRYHHSKDSLYYGEDGKEIESIGDLVRTGEVEVPGNFGGTVLSTHQLDMGRFCLEHLLGLFPKVNCYNCSNGVKVKNTFAVHSEDLMLPNNLPDKLGLIEHIKTNSFVTRDVDKAQYQEWLANDAFIRICDHMVQFIDRDFKSRAEMATALVAQVRYLFDFSHTAYRHIYIMLEGSLNYVQSVFRMILYGFADEQQTLILMQQAFAIFKEYMNAAKTLYAGALDSIDQTPSILMDMFKEGLSDNLTTTV